MVGADGAPYGFVVESVNVSVLLYVPVRRASPAPMACLKATVTGSLLTGPGQVSKVVGLGGAADRRERGARAGRARRRRAQRLRERERAVDEAPVAFVSASATDSVALPAVLITFAVVVASYSRAIPGVNGPNVAGVPSVSDSVAGTVPPTPPCVHSDRFAS